MALLPTGSDKIPEIQTGKDNIVINRNNRQTFPDPVPEIFFGSVKAVFDRFVRSVSRIIASPHHQIVTDHRVVLACRAKAVDGKSKKWLIGHPEFLRKNADGIRAEKVLAAQKQISYDTAENRFAKDILILTAKMFSDFRRRYADTQKNPDPDVLLEADRMLGTVRKLVSGSFLSSVSEYRSAQSMLPVSCMAPGYLELFKYYRMLRRGLAETLPSEPIFDPDESAVERTSLPREIETELAKVDWNVSNVLVGSLRSEEQFDINYSRKFYHVPASKVMTSRLPIRYVAMYRPKSWSDPGIRYYGEVTAASVVRRKEIPVPMRNRNNGEEPYYFFRVKRWNVLPAAIEVKEEGVYEPKYTNLFLLKNCRQSYELFHIHSEEQYRLVCELRRIFSDTSVNEKESGREQIIRIGTNDVIRAREGYFDLCGGSGEIIERIRITDYAKHPRLYFEKIKRAAGIIED